MHFEILGEDQSGKKALDIIVPRMIGNGDTFRVFSYKGIGKIPKNLKGKTDPRKRILLDRLPRLLQGYGKAFSSHAATVIVVCDLDNRCLKAFRSELVKVLNACDPKPKACFCFAVEEGAVEEGEAWFLGDIAAIVQAYPGARRSILENYVNDSICGTWETLADAITHPGGAAALSGKGWKAVGREKAQWAANISPHMDMENNKSPGFRYFREKIRLPASPDVVFS